MNMLAVIRTGGKQYLVSEGSKVKVEKLEAEVGATIDFEVLFTGDEKSVVVGVPVLEKAKVTGTVLRQDRADKVTGIKFKAKKRELTHYGHRQAFTEVEITKISA